MVKKGIRKTAYAIIVLVGLVLLSTSFINTASAKQDCDKVRVNGTVQSTEVINDGQSVRIIIDLPKKELARIKAEDEERIKAERDKLKKLIEGESLQELLRDPFFVIECVLIAIGLVVVGVFHLKELKADGKWPFNKKRR